MYTNSILLIVPFASIAIIFIAITIRVFYRTFKLLKNRKVLFIGRVFYACILFDSFVRITNCAIISIKMSCFPSSSMPVLLLFDLYLFPTSSFNFLLHIINILVFTWISFLLLL